MTRDMAVEKLEKVALLLRLGTPEDVMAARTIVAEVRESLAVKRTRTPKRQDPSA